MAQSQTLARLEGKLDMLLQEREKDKIRMTEQDQRLSYLMNQLSDAQEANRVLAEQNELLRSPGKEKANDDSVQPACEQQLPLPPQLNIAMAVPTVLAPAKRLAPVFDPNQAQMNKKPKADKSDSTSTANKTITELLQSLSSEGRLKHLNDWRDINLNLDNIGQKQSVRNVLELCQYVCTREETNALKDGCNGDDGELLKTCKLVGKKAFMQMWAFEGVEDLETEFNKNKAAGSKGKAMTYNAVGIRVKDYKKSLVPSGCGYNNIRLGEKQG